MPHWNGTFNCVLNMFTYSPCRYGSTKKLKYLRNQFTDECRKMTTSKSGMAADDIYHTKWKFYEPLKFLIRYVNVKPSHTSNMSFQVGFLTVFALTFQSICNVKHL